MQDFRTTRALDCGGGVLYPNTQILKKSQYPLLAASQAAKTDLMSQYPNSVNRIP